MIAIQTGFDRAIRQWDSFLKGKRVMLTIENPDSAETNRRMIRVPAEQAGWRRPPKGGEIPKEE